MKKKSKLWKVIGGAIVVMVLVGICSPKSTNPQKVLAGSKAVQEVNELFEILETQEANFNEIQESTELSANSSDGSYTVYPSDTSYVYIIPSHTKNNKQALINCIIGAELKKRGIRSFSTVPVRSGDHQEIKEWKSYISNKTNITTSAYTRLEKLCKNIQKEAKHHIDSNVSGYRRRAAAEYIKILEKIDTQIVKRYQFNKATGLAEECIHSIKVALATKNK